MNKQKEVIKYIVLAILLILLSVGTFILLKKHTYVISPETVEAQQIMIFNLSLDNWGTLLTSIGLLGTAIWSMFQYSKSKKSSQQEKSAEIANHFSENLLSKCSLVIRVFTFSKLYGIIKVVSEGMITLEDFTCNELRELTGDDEFPHIYSELKEKANLDNIYYSLIERRITTNNDFTKKYEIKNTNKIKLHNYTTKQARKLFVLDNKDLPFHFSALVDEVLNDLESVCMNLSSNAADSNYIYPSLHQTMFDTIEILGIEIALRNNGKYSDKFYTNIIHVYTSWKSLYNKTLKKEHNKKQKNNRTLSPKVKTV